MNVHTVGCPRHANVPFGECLCEHQQELERQEVADTQHLAKENGEKYRAAAKRRWGDEGFVEIDDNAKVSRADDPEAEPGAYVQAWVWVDNAEAGIK